jgi:uncharacterized membrane protein YkoI
MIMTIKFSICFAVLAILITTTIGFLPISTSSNVFAQTNASSSTNATDMTGTNMMMKDNYNNPMMGMENKTHEKINGTINMMSTMYQAIQSKVNTTLTQAITTAEQYIGNNSYAMSANGEEKGGVLVYSIILGSPDMKFNKVLVDPGNGQILQSKELSMMDWMMMMHSGGGHEGMKKMDMHGDYDQGKGMKGMHDDYGGDQGKYDSGW